MRSFTLMLLAAIVMIMLVLIGHVRAEPLPYPKPRDGRGIVCAIGRLLRAEERRNGAREHPQAAWCAMSVRLGQRRVVVRADALRVCHHVEHQKAKVRHPDRQLRRILCNG
jgi:hypothetical protein